jgi:hypothetical protein
MTKEQAIHRGATGSMIEFSMDEFKNDYPPIFSLRLNQQWIYGQTKEPNTFSSGIINRVAGKQKVALSWYGHIWTTTLKIIG